MTSAPRVGGRAGRSSSSDATIVGAVWSDSIVSKRGTIRQRLIEQAGDGLDVCLRLGSRRRRRAQARRPRSGARMRAVAPSVSAVRGWSSSRACTRTSRPASWKPKISSRRRRAASRPSARRPQPAARRLRSISSRSAANGTGGLVAAIREPPPDERQLAPVRLGRVPRTDLGCVLAELALVARDRLVQLGVPRDERRGDAERGRELAHLAGVPRRRNRARPLHRLLDRALVDRGVPVEVAADPAAEVERRRTRRRARGTPRGAPRPRPSASARRTRARGGSRPSPAAAPGAPRPSSRAR